MGIRGSHPAERPGVDDEPLSAAEETALAEGLAALRRGDVLPLDRVLPSDRPHPAPGRRPGRPRPRP